MKRLLLIMALALPLAMNAQITPPTNSPPTNVVPPIPVDTVWNFIRDAGTNLAFSAYGLYDLTTKTGGAGVAMDYHISPYVGAAIRLDYLNHEILMPVGNVQLQLPLKIGPLVVVPFAVGGAGTPLSGQGANNGDIVWVMSTGASFHLTQNLSILAGYEHWSGAGFNDDVIGLGARWKF